MTHKSYWLFAFDDYCSQGGMWDFVGAAESLDKAKALVLQKDLGDRDNIEIWLMNRDGDGGKLLVEGSPLYDDADGDSGIRWGLLQDRDDHVDDGVKMIFQTEEPDYKELAVEGVAECYKSLKMTPPNSIEWVDDPITGLIRAHAVKQEIGGGPMGMRVRGLIQESSNSAQFLCPDITKAINKRCERIFTAINLSFASWRDILDNYPDKESREIPRPALDGARQIFKDGRTCYGNLEAPSLHELMYICRNVEGNEDFRDMFPKMLGIDLCAHGHMWWAFPDVAIMCRLPVRVQDSKDHTAITYGNGVCFEKRWVPLDMQSFGGELID